MSFDDAGWYYTAAAAVVPLVAVLCVCFCNPEEAWDGIVLLSQKIESLEVRGVRSPYKQHNTFL